ncbi:MAG: D-alanyl-D-alanine carboxypeptidase [Rhizobiaceae bacterium]|nr:D-alanyl-D-alanine carboxypeptidase [Rhizobiaceae bacterium]MCV0408749.1 D-alanyl-D-alanine carboxypeptidase [Rhizobiaceae bacterium]
MSFTVRLRVFIASALVIILAAGAAQAGPRLLLDAKTGKVLQHRQAFDRWHPASLTKLMTAYVTFRALKAGEISLTSGVRISKNALDEPPSKMAYPVGSVMTIDTALKIIMVKSANDIATAIAENVGKGEANFVARMNAEAARLGMTGTHYVNAHGLHDPEQYTTARDMAVLASQIRLEFPEYAGYFNIEAIQAGKNLMPTYNILMGRFPGADGMKTGFVCASGFNLIASATREGRLLIAVVMGAASQEARAVEAAELLHDGFSRTGENAVSIAALAPYGERQTVATDMREEICTQAAQSERYEQRDENGKLQLRSPYVVEPAGPPVAVAVSLGGATDEGWTPPQYADVPIPTPRPDYRPESASLSAGQGDALKQ